MRLAVNRMPALAQAEYLHQQRSIENRRRRWWVVLPGRLWMLLSIFAVSFIFMVVLGEGLGLFKLRAIPVQFRPIAFVLWIIIPGFALFPTAFVMHFGLLLRTLLWTANSVPREKVSGTWDLLLLTGVSGSAIVYNKWWATVRRAFPAYVYLAVLRAGVLFWIIEWTRLRVEFYPALAMEFNEYNLYPFSRLIGVLVVIFIFTLLNLPVTAAVGMLAAFVSKRSGWNTGLAAVIRSVIFLLPGGVVYLIMLFFPPYSYEDYYNSGAYYLYNLLMVAAIALGDNGMTLSALVTTISFDYMIFPRDHIIAIGSYVLPVLIYLLVMLLSLRLAAFLAQRQGAMKAGQKK
jgi:hypothetical protein